MQAIPEKIIHSILNSNTFLGNKEILNAEEIITTEYSVERQQALLSILEKGEYDKMNSFEPYKDLLGQELNIIRFTDEHDRVYYCLFYDSIELWQDPEVIAIVRDVP